MFEQTFKNIDDVLWKEAGCTTELDYKAFTRKLTADTAKQVKKTAKEGIAA